jgi:hypothetical protein
MEEPLSWLSNTMPAGHYKSNVQRYSNSRTTNPIASINNQNILCANSDKRYGKAMPDFDFTLDTSLALIELLTITFVRKLVASTG